MIWVREQIQIAAPVETVWAYLTQLDRLATINMFHRSVHFLDEYRAGVGTRMIVNHGLGNGPFMPRLVSISHWEQQRRIRWTEIAPDPLYRRYAFPHAQEFVLAPVGEHATLLTDTVTGTLNFPVPIAGKLLDALLARTIVRYVVRHECILLATAIMQC